MDGKFLDTFLSTADVYATFGLTSTAHFFAHHACTLSPSPTTILQLARLLAAKGDHRQVLHLLNPSNNHNLDPVARLLVAQSLFALAQYDACLTLLGEDEAGTEANLNALSLSAITSNSSSSSHVAFPRQLNSAMHVLRARVYERQDNVSTAVTWYKRALRTDLFCFEAFERLVYGNLYSPDEVRVFILDVSSAHVGDPGKDAASWLAAYYRATVDRSAPLPAPSSKLVSSIDMRHLVARRAFDGLNFSQCASIIREMRDENPHLPCFILITYLTALVELDERQELFGLAHQLVERDSKAAVSWLAVAYYYFCCGKPDISRRFFCKATTIDNRVAPAWIGLGHAFALQDESDQALAAYRTASRLFPGTQWPSLYMGMEYARQGSLAQATLHFQNAMRAHHSDPAPRHELGVVAFRMGDLPRAVNHFNDALSLWKEADSDAVRCSAVGRRAEAEETTLVNLGHCYRRLGQFPQAEQCYRRALSLRPRSPSTCTALGMTLHSSGDLNAAATMYHRALRDNPADSVCNDLLERTLHDMIDSEHVLDIDEPSTSTAPVPISD